uniref:Uncharacterized protein n=1 Tax=Lepeophtheirus salmonis TaxID=72036 RepID=A0A0K2UFI0_LEPSM
MPPTLEGGSFFDICIYLLEF